MRKKRGWVFLCVFVVVFGFSGFATAAPFDPLQVIGTASYNGGAYNLIYEEAQGLVWLDYSSPKTLTWQQQMDWAAGLGSQLTVTLDPFFVTDIDWTTGWRLPETADGELKYARDGTTSIGYNITSSEMGHLYYVSLENLGKYDTSGNRLGDGDWGLLNTGPFDNLEDGYYWSGTYYYYWFSQYAWYFGFYEGYQDTWKTRTDPDYALAVLAGQVYFADGSGNGTDPHSGDGNGTDPAPVPEPATMLLFGAGLIGLAGLRRKFRK